MRSMWFCFLPVCALWCFPLSSIGQTQPNNTSPLQADIKTLNKLGIPTDGAGLLTYFRKRTFSDVKPEQVESLATLLGSNDFQTREEAFQKISLLEAGAKPVLLQFKDSEDAEIRVRVMVLLNRIEEKSNPAIQSVVARVIAAQNPQGSCEVLLNYLPFAHESVIDDFRDAVAKVGIQNGQAEESLIKAMEDKVPVKRELAGEAIGKLIPEKHLPALKTLLKDKNHQVQYKVALALLKQKLKPQMKAITEEAIGTVIDLMAHLTPEELWPAEYILVRLAGEKEPSVRLGTDAVSRKQCSLAWKGWWDKNRANVNFDLLNKEDQRLGRLVVIHQSPNRFVNGKLIRGGRKIVEFDNGKQPRWEFVLENGNPVDVCGVGPRKILVAEYTGRITERDLEGRILPWEKYVTVRGSNNNPCAVKRLENGNTFIASRNQFIEMDRTGKTVYTFNRNRNDICQAGKLENGNIAFVTNDGLLSFLNPRNNQMIRSLRIGQLVSYNGGLETLHNNHVLVPLYNENKVVEYNFQGKKVWEASVSRPTTVTRLPNGHTVVGSLYSNQVVELNRNGEAIWTHRCEGQVYQVRVR